MYVRNLVYTYVDNFKWESSIQMASCPYDSWCDSHLVSSSLADELMEGIYEHIAYRNQHTYIHICMFTTYIHTYTEYCETSRAGSKSMVNEIYFEMLGI